MGARAEAIGVYRDLLSLPSTLVDREGYPFTSLAALALSTSFAREVLVRVRRDVDSLAALTLGQAYRWRDVLAMLQGVDSDRDPLIEKLSSRIAALEQMQKALEADPDLMSLRRDFRDLGVTESSWRVYRNLLISRAPAGPRRLVVAVRVGDVLQGLPFDPRIGGESGHALDEQYLPGLRATLAPVGPAETSLDLRR